MKFFSKSRVILAAVATVFTASTIVLGAAYADDGEVNITVSPYDSYITLQPGNTYRGSFRVSNSGQATADLKYETIVQTVSVNDENNDYVANFGGENTGYSDIVDWITIDSGADGVVKPHEDATVEYTISVPKDATPGGQYAAISVRQGGGSVEDGSVGVITRTSAAYMIFGKVAGQANESGNILENNISSIFLSKPLTATSIVENTGNVHGNATYTLKVYPLFSDEELYTNEENPEKHVILPGTRRFVNQTWNADDASPVGIYRMEQTVEFMGETSVTSKIIILCPMWLLLVIVFVIVFLIIWLVMRSKNRKAAAKKSSKSTGATSSSASAAKPADKPENSESPTHSEKSE